MLDRLIDRSARNVFLVLLTRGIEMTTAANARLRRAGEAQRIPPRRRNSALDVRLAGLALPLPPYGNAHTDRPEA